MFMTIQSSVKDKILATSSETSKVENAPAEMLRDLDQQMEKRADNDAAESVSDAIRFEYCLASSSGWIKSPVIWLEIGGSSLIGPELVQEMTNKVSPCKGVVGFGKKGKLAPSLHVPLDEIKVDKTLRFVEELVENSGREIKRFLTSFLDDGRGSGSWMFLFVWSGYAAMRTLLWAGKVVIGCDKGDSGDDDGDDDDNDEVTKDDDDIVDSDANGDKEASDSEKTDSDEDENPNLNQNNDEEELKETEHEEVGKGDEEMTDKTEVPLQSLSISSDFANQFLNLDNIPPTGTEGVSMMNIKVYHEEPSTQTPPFLNIPVTVIPETSTVTRSTIPITIPPITPLPQQSIPTLTPAPTTTTLIPALPDFSSLSYTGEFEKKAKYERKRYTYIVEKYVKDIIKDEVKSQLPQILPKEVSDYATPVI
ncbi:hypothetical protein Tco_0979853 [Tanacetum coccineum]